MKERTVALESDTLFCFVLVLNSTTLYNEIIVMKEKWHETAKDSRTE